MASNVYGFYTLTLPSGMYAVSVSYLGYATQRFSVDLTETDVKLNVELQPGLALGEAVVTGERENRIEEQVQMSKMEIPIDQIKALPAIGGEVDLLKSLFSFCPESRVGEKAQAASTSAAAPLTKTSCSSTVCRSTA